MKLHWRSLFEQLRTSYWLVPAAMSFAAFLAALFTLTVDRLVDWQASLIPFLYGGSPEGARLLLATLAGAKITVAGVLFSVTIVVLSLASQQFGPRLLRSFMSDRGSQVVLGAFLSGFLYDLLILSQVYEFEMWATPVPRFSVTLALVMAVFDFALLIYFVHHMASLVRAETILGRVARQLDREIERLYPEQLGQDPEPPLGRGASMPVDFLQRARPVHPLREGYIDMVDAAGLMDLAQEHDLLLRLPQRPGDFVFEDMPVVQAYPPERVDDNLAEAIARCVAISDLRTPTQDVEFPIHQLVEVACRALSPSMNDPFTAVTCVDRLGAAMAKLMRRRFPSPLRYHQDEHRLRVVAKTATFNGAMDAAFDMIRQSAHDSVGVSIRLLDVLRLLAQRAWRLEDYMSVLEHARKVQHEILATDLVEPDRDDVRSRYHSIVRQIKNGRSGDDRIWKSPGGGQGPEGIDAPKAGRSPRCGRPETPGEEGSPHPA